MTGEDLKELRKKLCLTQAQFAERVQIPRSSIALFEVGNRPISKIVERLICFELGLPMPSKNTKDIDNKNQIKLFEEN